MTIPHLRSVQGQASHSHLLQSAWSDKVSLPSSNNRHPAVSVYKTGALINFAVAGALTGVAVHNYGNRAVH